MKNSAKSTRTKSKNTKVKPADTAATPVSVSKKFYAGIMERIRSSVEFTHGDSDFQASLTAMVDAYLADGSEPDADSPFTVRLIFALLRPEIDKAAARSRAARERAAKKREAIERKDDSGKCGMIPVTEIIESVMTDTIREVTGDESVTYRLNRRQRREAEQLRKRLTRREERSRTRRE